MKDLQKNSVNNKGKNKSMKSVFCLLLCLVFSFSMTAHAVPARAAQTVLPESEAFVTFAQLNACVFEAVAVTRLHADRKCHDDPQGSDAFRQPCLEADYRTVCPQRRMGRKDRVKMEFYLGGHYRRTKAAVVKRRADPDAWQPS